MSRPTRWPVRVKRGNSTVAIYRIKRKKNGRQYVEFKLAFYDELGKRKFQSFSDFNRARQAADNLNVGLMKGEVKSLMLSNDDKVVYLRALKALEPTGSALDLAAHQFAEAVKVLKGASLLEAARFYIRRNPVELPRKSVQEVVEEFLKSRQEANRSEEYLHDLRSRQSRFAGVFHTAIGDLTRSEVVRFLSTLGLGPRSQFNYCKVLRTFFEFAKTMGYLPKDHSELEGLAMGDDDPGQIEIYTPAEMRALLSVAGPEMVPVLAIGGFAGLRSKEVERLDWSEVQLGRGFIELKRSKTKTARRRLVPIAPNLVPWLSPYAQESGHVWVYGSSNLSRLKAEVAKDAGVPWRHNALRHSFASYRLAQLQNANQVALESGHSVKVLFTNYRELVTPEEAKGWFGIVPEEIGAVEIYTPAEMRAMLSAAPAELIAPLVLGGFCGLRRAEVEELDWAEVDLAGEVIKPKHQEVERGRPRAVAILPNLAEWLRGRHRAGGRLWQPSGGSLAEALRQTAEQAGVRWREDGLRHSYAGYRLAQVRDTAEVATETGYSPHTLFSTFAELATREEAASWFGIVPATAIKSR